MNDLPTLVLLHGLPRSGKSTEARQLREATGAPVVNRDAVRLALHGRRFAAEAEPFVNAVVHVMVAALFGAGHEYVILDECNVSRKRRDEWRSPAWKRAFVTIDTPKEECLARAQRSGDAEIVPVIERMAAAWEPVAPEETAAP